MKGNKDDVVKCLRIGKEALKSGDLNRALKMLSKACRLDPSLLIDHLLAVALCWPLMEPNSASPPSYLHLQLNSIFSHPDQWGRRWFNISSHISRPFAGIFAGLRASGLCRVAAPWLPRGRRRTRPRRGSSRSAPISTSTMTSPTTPDALIYAYQRRQRPPRRRSFAD